jgi:hypothetical protein
VVELFRSTISKFCKDEALRYQWINYLPDRNDSNRTRRPVEEMIISTLSSAKILESRSGNGLFEPSKLRILGTLECDKSGNPLVPDLPEEIYLSGKYAENSERLNVLGTTRINTEEILDRVEADLAKANLVPGCIPHIRAWGRTEDWQERFARLLLHILSSEPSEPLITKRIRSLEIIPLIGGEWTSALKGDFYFPDDELAAVPADLGLNLVKREALVNDARKTLFLKLGLKHSNPDEVIKLITQKYKEVSSNATTLNDSLDHFKYLYWKLPQVTTPLDESIRIFSHILKGPNDSGQIFRQGRMDVRLHGLNAKNVYFENSKNVYGPLKLFKAGKSAPGLLVYFLRPEYLDLGFAKLMRNEMTFRTWLENTVGVRGFPPLSDDSGEELSPEFTYLIENRSDILLEILREYWNHYESVVNTWPTLRKKLSEVMVLTRGGSKKRISDSFLPCSNLEKKVGEFKADNFPFLTINCNSTQEENEWQFLSKLGVGVDDSLRFYIRSLELIKTNHLDNSLDVDQSGLCRLLKFLDLNHTEHRAKIRLA